MITCDVTYVKIACISKILLTGNNRDDVLDVYMFIWLGYIIFGQCSTVVIYP